MNTILTNKTILTKHSTKAKLKLASPHTLIIYLLNLSTGTDTTISERNTKPGYQETELQSTRVENRHRISFQIHLSILQDRGGTTLVIIKQHHVSQVPQQTTTQHKITNNPQNKGLCPNPTQLSLLLIYLL